MKKLFFFVQVLILVPVISWSQDIDDARELIENERYVSAEELLEKQTPTVDPELNYLLVKTYLEQDKKKEAGEFITRHFQSPDASAQPLNRVAHARYLLHMGKKQEALAIFTGLLDEKKNQKDPALLLAMAEVMIDEKDGDANLALSWLEMALKRDKHNADLLIAKGQAYRKLGDASNAFLSYQEAVKEDPRNVRAHYVTGKIFTAQKNPEIYLEHFMKAYAIDPHYAPVLEELYKHYYYRDITLAKRYLQEYIANTDASLQNRYDWTDILFLNAEYDEAIRSANEILEKEGTSAQPRLYKLIAYAHARSGDSAKALSDITQYFSKEDPKRVIAADYELIAQLTERNPGQEEGAIAYYSIAAEMDTLTANKAKYAASIVELLKKKKDYSKQAQWLGKLYQWKERTNNVDLFNWGVAHYMAKEYALSDTVFSKYTTRYPEDIYGHYWRAQSSAAIDTAMTDSLAVPHFLKVVEIGEKNKEANRKMLLKAYGYLGGFEANITKDYAASLGWFKRYQELDKENAEVTGYIEMLEKWLADKTGDQVKKE